MRQVCEFLNLHLHDSLAFTVVLDLSIELIHLVLVEQHTLLVLVQVAIPHLFVFQLGQGKVLIVQKWGIVCARLWCIPRRADRFSELIGRLEIAFAADLRN